MSACEQCLRRTAVLAALAPWIARTDGRIETLRPLLALSDERLAAALTARAEVRAVRDGFDPAVERERCEAARLVALCRHAAGYPEMLRDLGDDVPAVLHVSGAGRLQALLAEPAVSVVGARRASQYGLEVARGLGRGLATARVTVVSGMALGVDAAAHTGALEGGDGTVAVLAGGADVPYPASKRTLYTRIAARGAVLSEFPPGFRPQRWCFPARNRIIAGLGGLTVVVEGLERSGSLITARVARDLGREVGAVPGQVTAPLAAGSNALIRDGAHLVDGPQAALDVVCGVGARSVSEGAALVEPRLRAVLDAVAGGRDTLGALAAAGARTDEAMVALAELELLGHVRRTAGGRYVAALHAVS